MEALLLLLAIILIGIAFKRKRYNPLWLLALTVVLSLIHIGLVIAGDLSDRARWMIGITQGCLLALYAIRDFLGLPKNNVVS